MHFLNADFLHLQCPVHNFLQPQWIRILQLQGELSAEAATQMCPKSNPSQMDSGARALKLMTGFRCWPGTLAGTLYVLLDICLGGRDVLKRSALMCKELFPGLIYLHCVTNLSSHDIDSSLTAEGSRSSSMNASVTSRNALHVAHTVFFPLPEKDTVSHPVKAWKMGRVLQYLESILAISSWIAMFRKCDPVPRITHSSSGLILSNEATASTNKSVSTVRILTLL